MLWIKIKVQLKKILTIIVENEFEFNSQLKTL